MRKNYFFLIILFVIFASFKASAFNITVNVDDVSRVTLYLGSSKQALSNGDNVLDVKTGDRLYFSANTGYVLKSVMNGDKAETISSPYKLYDWSRRGHPHRCKVGSDLLSARRCSHSIVQGNCGRRFKGDSRFFGHLHHIPTCEWRE